MLLRHIFASDVTRAIPPVVYFHEQTPQKLADEVSEYIITGGWPPNHPNHNRVPNGIHEQYVHLINAITAELDRAGGPELPNCWISGFYGSGKSSFAKLLGLALDGVALPDGSSLADAWLRRDTSPGKDELAKAWKRLKQKVNPMAVVFDVGAVGRDNEHIHSAVVRMVQQRLHYCSTDPLVGEYELKLERDGHWKRFEQEAERVLNKPWREVRSQQLADHSFSAVMHAMFPEIYQDPLAWVAARAGTGSGAGSPEDAVAAIRDMMKFRKPDGTLFIVVDEVSQYVLGNKDRVDRLRAFATALGSGLKGKAWLLALGQQKLDEQADDSFLKWAKDRFPQQLQVHLAPTNIRDVIHKRLLAKKPSEEAGLKARFEKNRTALKLYAYGCDAITAEDYVETYPLLPGHVDLLLQITTALRTRSSRAQGDDQAIRGLLQLLGELFRGQKLADEELGALITFDRIYEVQHTALDSDTQASMARILSQCAEDATGQLVRVAKVVALLELIQESVPTTAELVAKCLYDRDDRGNNQQTITEALEELRRRNLLGYSEKLGYKLQSSAGEEWERDRRDVPAQREARVEAIQEALKKLVTTPERPKLQGRPFAWEAVFSDGRRVDNATLVPSRDEATVCIDFRFLSREERSENVWVQKSSDPAVQNKLIWVSGDSDDLENKLVELIRSVGMVQRHRHRRESLSSAKKMLLLQEENRSDELLVMVEQAVAATWLHGRMYFRGQAMDPRTLGNAFSTALVNAATAKLPDIYNKFVVNTVQPSELQQLLVAEISGAPKQFMGGDLGILELDSNRYVPTCSGVVPKRIAEFIEEESGVSGTALLSRFGGPPYGYHPNVVKACVAGLLRAKKLKISPESGEMMTAVRDTGVNELFEKDRPFKKASFFPAGEDAVGYQARARICRFFKEQLKHAMDVEDHAIADAVQSHFNNLAKTTREVLERLQHLEDKRPAPAPLLNLQHALEDCLRNVRQTEPTVLAVKKNLDTLRDGVQMLMRLNVEVDAKAIQEVNAAVSVRNHHAVQLEEVGALDAESAKAAKAIRELLGAEKPWEHRAALDEHASVVRKAYVAERSRLMARQESMAEAARGRIKLAEGFSTLTADKAHEVLRPINAAVTMTTPEAIAPSLLRMKEAFDAALNQAEEHALGLLDDLRSQKHLVVRVDLRLKNRELASAADVDTLLAEIRERLLAQIDPAKGTRVRIG